MIIKMRDGYDTQIAAGTRCRPARRSAWRWAGAVRRSVSQLCSMSRTPISYRGDEALTRAVRSARERGAVVVVVAHRPIGIEAVDQLLVLRDGRMQAFGPKERFSGRCCSGWRRLLRSRSYRIPELAIMMAAPPSRATKRARGCRYGCIDRRARVVVVLAGGLAAGHRPRRSRAR